MKSSSSGVCLFLFFPAGVCCAFWGSFLPGVSPLNKSLFFGFSTSFACSVSWENPRIFPGYFDASGSSCSLLTAEVGYAIPPAAASTAILSSFSFHGLCIFLSLHISIYI